MQAFGKNTLSHNKHTSLIKKKSYLGQRMNYLILLLSFGIANAGIDREDEPELVKRVYNNYCSSCHTKENKIVKIDKEKEDSEMIITIRSGTGGMPTYSWLFTDDDLKKLIEYMRINSEK